MQNKVMFQEKQGFTQWWLYLILCLPLSFLIYEFFAKTIQWPAVWIELIIIICIIGFVFSIQLKTVISENGICVKFFPFLFKERLIHWNEIKTCEVRQYHPIREYGGWGWRYSFKNGKAYNTKGNFGLQLVFDNDKKLLIGTQKPEELKQVLQTLNKH